MTPAKRWWCVTVDVEVRDERGLFIPHGYVYRMESYDLMGTARGRLKAEKKALRLFGKLWGPYERKPGAPGARVDVRATRATRLLRTTKSGKWRREKGDKAAYAEMFGV